MLLAHFHHIVDKLGVFPLINPSVYVFYLFVEFLMNRLRLHLFSVTITL